MSSAGVDADPPAPRRDTVFNVSATALYSLALSTIAVAFPLFALQSGYDAAMVGAIVAASAITQILARSAMGPLMRHIADKHLIAASAVLLAVSSGLFLVSAELWLIVVAQLIQGVSRALFWTANQTHAVRAHESAVRGLAMNNFWNGAGSLCGPLLCGLLLAFAPIQAPIAASALAAALTVVPSALLVRFRPFVRVDHGGDGHRIPRPVWARRELLPASLMSTAAGVWRGLLNSLVPVVLVHAGHDEATTSLLIGCANAAVLFASPIARRVQDRGIVFATLAGVGPIAIGLAATGLAPQLAPLVAVALFVSGLGGGLAQTLGPSAATGAVHAEERGQAIASIGTFRAVALFVTPLAVAGLVLVIPAAATLVVVAVAASMPAVALAPRRRPDGAPPE